MAAGALRRHTLLTAVFCQAVFLLFVAGEDSAAVRHWARGGSPRTAGNSPNSYAHDGVNGGKPCAICTTVVALSEQLAEIHNVSIAKGLQKICSFLPDKFRTTCNAFLEEATPILIEMVFDKSLTPDVVCHLLHFCYTEKGLPSCHVFPPPAGGLERAVEKARRKLSRRHPSEAKLRFDDKTSCPNVPVLKELCEAYERFSDKKLPLFDIDKDSFSDVKSFRGSFWRGRDCNDFNSHVHPGARAINRDKYTDSDCNGIFGMDPKNGQAYEDTLCRQTPHMGIAILGDSAGAHMHIPKEWFTASELSKDAFRDLPMIIANDIDWPMTSSVTGYMNSTWSVLDGLTDSLYLRLRDLNHCNHRDYQNLGVNGAKSFSLANDIVLSRDPKQDHPMIVIYSLIGNDVCNAENDTVAHMTTEDQMKENFLKTLNILDARLPNGSYVIATSLADGRVLYDILKDRVHPVGEWRQNVKYPDVYNYLTCLHKSPCNGWMSSNETLRNLTTERAVNLSRVLRQVAATHKANNFQVLYVDLHFTKLIEQWVARGGEPWQLIEPVDGFHPNQIGLALEAEEIWKEMKALIPDAIKKWTNPNNARIRSVFGDQGGY